MGVVFIANGFLAWLALSTWPGLETKQHYQKGVAYNQTLDAAERQARLGWQVALDLVPVVGDAPRTFEISVRYADADGGPLGGLRVRAHFVRPVHEGYDQTIELAKTAPGTYGARVALPLAGQWDVRLVAANGDGNTHQNLERVRVP